MSYLYLALKSNPSTVIDLGYTISFRLMRATIIAVKQIPASTEATVDNDTYTAMPKYYNLRSRMDNSDKVLLESHDPADIWYIGYGDNPAGSRAGDIAEVKVNNENYEMVMGRSSADNAYQWLATLRLIVVA